MKSDNDALLEAMAIMSGLLLGGPYRHLDARSREEIESFMARETEPMGSGRGRPLRYGGGSDLWGAKVIHGMKADETVSVKIDAPDPRIALLNQLGFTIPADAEVTSIKCEMLLKAWPAPGRLCGGDHCSGLWNLPCDDPKHPRTPSAPEGS